MKIGLGSLDNAGQAQNTSQTSRVGQTSGGTQSQKTQHFGLDKVDVSDVAQTAASVISTSGNQRAQQVANLTQSYQSGQYRVDPAKLSKAIVDQDTESSSYGH